MSARILKWVIRGIVAFNSALWALSFFRSTGTAIMDLLRWAHLGYADFYWLLVSTAALSLLVVAEAVIAWRASGVPRGQAGWLRRHADVLIDATLVLGWTIFLILGVRPAFL